MDVENPIRESLEHFHDNGVPIQMTGKSSGSIVANGSGQSNGSVEADIRKLEDFKTENGIPPKGKYAADLMSILEARKRIAPYIHTTPVVTSSTLDALAGCNLFFKCELLQKGYVWNFPPEIPLSTKCLL